jgi:hypothetical protein
VQAIFLYLEKDCGPIFGHCRRLFSLSMILLATQAAILLIKPIASTKATEFWLPISQIVSVFILSLASISIPRRPDVYFNGQLVDGMRTGSLFSRHSFYWANALLKKAVEKGRFSEDDLPAMDRARRAERLQEEFYAIRRSPELYWHIVRAHWPWFFKTWATTLIGVAATFTPPLILNRILFYLEQRDKGEGSGREAWLWIAALGLIKLFEAVILAYLYWFVLMDVPAVPRVDFLTILISRQGLLHGIDDSHPEPIMCRRLLQDDAQKGREGASERERKK